MRVELDSRLVRSVAVVLEREARETGKRIAQDAGSISRQMDREETGATAESYRSEVVRDGDGFSIAIGSELFRARVRETGTYRMAARPVLRVAVYSQLLGR